MPKSNSRGRKVEVENEKSEDNWKHRAANMLCASCMWYMPKVDNADKGRCRRRSPTMSGWPVMFPTDWCGDHKLA